MDILKTCSPFSEKYAAARSVFESFSPVHTKTLERWKYASIPCALWSKTSVFVRPFVKEKLAFSTISTLRAVFENLRFWCSKRTFTCGREDNTEKIRISGYVWTRWAKICPCPRKCYQLSDSSDNQTVQYAPLVSLRNDFWETGTNDFRIPYCWRQWRVTTKIWVVLLIGWNKFLSRHDQSEELPRSVTRHQYGIAALVFQTSFRGETSGGVLKCRLFSQATQRHVVSWALGKNISSSFLPELWSCDLLLS